MVLVCFWAHTSFRTTLESLGPNSRQAGLMERACRSPTCREVFTESTLRLKDCNGSNMGPFRAIGTVGKSQGGTLQGRWGFILLAPRNRPASALAPAIVFRTRSGRPKGSRRDTCRAHNSGRGCHIVPFTWERRSHLKGIGRGAAITLTPTLSEGPCLQRGAIKRSLCRSSLTRLSTCGSNATGGKA